MHYKLAVMGQSLPEVIPLRHILLTRRMKESIYAHPLYQQWLVQTKQKDLTPYFEEDDQDTSFPLSRIESNEHAFRNDIPLPPIHVTTHHSTSERGRTPQYSILNGRHRFVLSVLYGYDEIPVILS